MGRQSKNSTAILVAILVAVAVAAAAAQQPVPQAPDTVIHAGRLIDGASATVRDGVSILIAGDRIVRVDNGFVAPIGATVIIAVAGDPLKDVTELQRVIFVMKGGRVYKGGGPGRPATGTR